MHACIIISVSAATQYIHLHYPIRRDPQSLVLRFDDVSTDKKHHDSSMNHHDCDHFIFHHQCDGERCFVSLLVVLMPVVMVLCVDAGCSGVVSSVRCLRFG